MLLIWQGRGLFVVVASFPILASCAGLIDVEPKWIFGLSVGLAFLLAGWICHWSNHRWRAPGVVHSFYFIPLRFWGWIFTAIGTVGSTLFTLLSALQALNIVKPPPQRGTSQDLWLAAALGAFLTCVSFGSIFLCRRCFPSTQEGEEVSSDPYSIVQQDMWGENLTPSMSHQSSMRA